MKQLKKILILALFIIFHSFYSKAQNKIKQKEVLLIGTFHFNNPNADAIKTDPFDVTSAESQQELENITNQIKRFNPNKIFVEWDFDKQASLDSLYKLYLDGQYETFIQNKYKSKNRMAFYLQNEIFQLAFKAGKKSGLNTVNGIDYHLNLPFDTVMNAIKNAKQDTLMHDIIAYIKRVGEEKNLKRKTLNLTQLILDLNTPASRAMDMGFYMKAINKAGSPESFAGSYSVAEWYKRNLYMYSLVQKITQSTDDRIVILLGASHVAMLKSFIELENQFKVVELKDILKK